MTIKRLFLDSETTGTDNKIHGIHQYSGCVEIDGIVVEEFDLKCRPFDGAVIERGALEINGKNYDEEYARIMSYPPESELYSELVRILKRYINPFNKKEKFLVIGFNVKFDIEFTYQLFIRNGDNYLFSLIWGNSVDISSEASIRLEHLRPEMENFKLITVAKTLGIVLDEEKLHDSLYDIKITRDCFYLLKEPNLKIVDLNKTPEIDNGKNILPKNLKDVFLTPSKVSSASATNNQSVSKLKSLIKINDDSHIITFGTHRGLSVDHILKYNPQWLIWAHDNTIQGIVVSQEILNRAFSSMKNIKDKERLNNGTRPDNFSDVSDDLPF